MNRVLIIEDDPRVAGFLQRGLGAEGYRVTLATDGPTGLAHAERGAFDLILLDRMLPGMSGHSVCERLRAGRIATPILMLTAMDAVEDKVQGLRLGADDYLTKPFDFDELLARIEALLRRQARFEPRETRLVLGDLYLDRETCEVRRGGDALMLTATEMALLALLMAQPGKVFSRERILSHVWGQTRDPLTNVVDVYIRRLRSKIDRPDQPSLIETVRGRGYRIIAPRG